MLSMPTLQSLSAFNTLGLNHYCEQLIKLETKQQLINHCCDCYQSAKPFLVLGGGSNLVFTEDFHGTVLQVNSKGVKVSESDEHFFLEVEAGENWHDLVATTLKQGIFGLENLALIPGVVGAAPIQNIGAYGCEFAQFCDWVEYVDLTSGDLVRLTAEQCHFGYRDSIFKQELKNSAVITAVGLKLTKKWQPCLRYGPLQSFNSDSVSAQMIFDQVCEVRMDKLPDPAKLGNVGSFFKNPIVGLSAWNRLKLSYPELVAYAVSDTHMKLAAGWLIDQAGLKGFSVGQAAIHKRQALVIINLGGATGSDVCQLALAVIDKVYDLFGVKLEAEPRIINATGEGSLSDER